MGIGRLAFVLAAVLPGVAQSLSASGGAEVDKAVRAFAAAVAQDVTAKGPAAWRTHFADDPAFFMAVNGHLAFPSGAAIMAAIPDIQRMYKSIELQWGDDLRVDPLTPRLAMMAASYNEVQVKASGETVDERGFFSGLAELRAGRWQFRNAHWSSAGR